eukprot:SAG31_NODE_1628_length_7704_cov_27.599606_5_plen_102_part_00
MTTDLYGRLVLKNKNVVLLNASLDQSIPAISTDYGIVPPIIQIQLNLLMPEIIINNYRLLVPNGGIRMEHAVNLGRHGCCIKRYENPGFVPIDMKTRVLSP